MSEERISALTCSKTSSSLFAADCESGNYFRLPLVCLNYAIIKKIVKSVFETTPRCFEDRFFHLVCEAVFY